MILSALLFFGVFLFFIFLPGFFLYTFLTRTDDSLGASALSIGIGCSVWMVVSFFFSWLHFPLGIPVVVLPFSILGLLRMLRDKKFFLKDFLSFEFLFILLGSCLMVFYTWNSGTIVGNGIRFYGVNSVDGIYHLSLIQSLIQGFPPEHLALADIPIRGYNFLYDLLVGSFVSVFHFSLLDTFFRFFPLLTAFLFGLSALTLARALGISRRMTMVTIVCLYTLRGCDWYLNWLFSTFLHIPFTSSGIMQSPEQLIDASVAFSLSILFLAISLFCSQKRSRAQFWTLVLLGAVLPTIKIYTGFLFFTSLGCIACLSILKSRDWWYLKLVIASAVLAACIYLPINYGAGKLVFAPLVLYHFYIENAAVTKYLHWNVNIALFEQKHNILRLTLLYGTTFLLYVVPAFGLRILGFFQFFKKAQWKSISSCLLFLLVGIGILMPTLFIQTVAPLVIIQFFWLTNILLIFLFVQFLDQWIGKKTVWVTIGLGIFLVLFSLPDLCQSVNGYIRSSFVTGKSTREIVSLLQQVPLSQTTLVLGKEEGDMTPILTALSGKRIYFEKNVMEFANTEKVLHERGAQVYPLAEGLQNCTDVQTQNTTIQNLLYSQHIPLVIVTKQMYSCLSHVHYQMRAQTTQYLLLTYVP